MPYSCATKNYNLKIKNKIERFNIMKNILFHSFLNATEKNTEGHSKN